MTALKFVKIRDLWEFLKFAKFEFSIYGPHGEHIWYFVAIVKNSGIL